MDSKSDFIITGFKLVSLIYLAGFGIVPLLLIKNMREYIDLEMLINEYELKELKQH